MGAATGIVLYIGSRIFAPTEEVELAQTFGTEWEDYSRSVMLPGFEPVAGQPSSVRAAQCEATGTVAKGCKNRR